MENNCGCIARILNVINTLQQNADCPDACLDTCDRGFLGCNIATVGCNTRPVMIYTCGGNGVAFSMPISKEPDEAVTSNVFRVEKVDGNCATFRVLTPNTDTETNLQCPYSATNSFFTMDLDCVCAIRCLNDTCVACI